MGASVRRIRTIKPEFFTDEGLAELSIPTRLLFIALWTMADREGRLEDKPRSIKLASFPWDEVDVETSLGDLAAGGFIARYTVEGKPYIEITNFLKHQRINTREAHSTFPSRASTCTHVQGDGEGKGREGKGREREASSSRTDLDPHVVRQLLASAEKSGDEKGISHYSAVLSRIQTLP